MIFTTAHKKTRHREDAALEMIRAGAFEKLPAAEQAAKEAGAGALGTIDAAGLAVFSAIEVHRFTSGQMAAVHSHVTRLPLLDALIALLQAPGLLRIEPAGGNAVVDAVLLVVEATAHFIDPRTRAEEGEPGTGAVRHSEGAQHGDSGNGEKRFHGV